LANNQVSIPFLQLVSLSSICTMLFWYCFVYLVLFVARAKS
jgi:hypothetical protein